MSVNQLNRASVEPLEGRRLLAVLRPDHVVIVIEQDRASNAIGHPLMPYLTSLATSGLNYTNAHGVTHPSTPNSLALFSGSTQGVTDNARGLSFAGGNLARSLFNAGMSFSGYVESLPADGSQVTQAGTAAFGDLYTRNLNAMAQFTDYGIDPATNQPRTNAKVNRTFNAFSSLPTNDYSSLPTVSFIIPNNLHSTHGSNETAPWAGSPDEANNDILRKSADDWLRDQMDGYLQWAKANNSLLIITQDEERWTGGTASTVTTVVNGDPDLFTPGTNSASVNHYNVLRTVEEMYGLPLLGDSASAASLATDAQGRLSGGQAPTAAATTTGLTRSVASSVAGQTVTFTAAVTSAAGMPTGTVTFRDGTTVVATAAVNSAGIATFTTSALTVGSHSISAAFAANSSFLASTSPTLTHSVSKAATTTVVAASTSPSTPGQSVTFSARVTTDAPGTGVATGTVQFQIDGVNFGSPVTLVNGFATSNATSALTVGIHAVKAIYAGSALLVGSTSATFSHTVAAATNYDNFANRAQLSGNSATLVKSNSNYTKQTGEPKHAGNKGGRSLWATWTATASGNVTLDTFGSNIDTLLAVYTGTAVGALTAVKSNDDASTGGVQSLLTFAAVAGKTYQIAVDGYDGVAGSITLHLNVAGAAPAGLAASKTTSTTTPSLWSTIAVLLK